MAVETSEFNDNLTYSGLPAPAGWFIQDRTLDGYMWRRTSGQAISVIESIARKEDGCRWLHVSVAKPNKKMPTYEDIQEMRRLFIGEERECYMIFVPRARYVNINPVLHLFCNLDHPEGVLPHMEGKTNVPGEIEIAGVKLFAWQAGTSI